MGDSNILRKKARTNLNSSALYIGLVLIIILFSIICKMKGINYLSFSNVTNIFVQSSIIGVVAIGTSCIILTGGIDLASGAMLAFDGMFCATCLTKFGLSVVPAVILTIVVCCLVYFLCGVGVAYGKIPAFIVTLGAMSMGEGGALAISSGQPISGLPRVLGAVARTTLLNVPLYVFILILLYAVMIFVIKKTKFGYMLYALGGNRQAARLSGINVNKLEIIVYTISGFFTAIASIMLLCRLTYGSPSTGVGYEMDAIASCVIGGISLNGGQGKLFNTFVGAMLLAVLKNGLQVLGISTYYQSIITGLIVIAAVFIDKAQDRKEE